MKVSYYPGCSLHSTGVEYGESTKEVFKILDIELEELPDWCCCGASSAHCTDEALAIELAVRNLATAEEAGMDLVIPCAACFQRFKVAEKHIKEGKEPAVDTPYQGKVPVKHLLDFLVGPVSKLNGLMSIETHLILKVLKRTFAFHLSESE